MHLGLKPRDVDTLTVAEFKRMCSLADRMNEEAAQAANQ